MNLTGSSWQITPSVNQQALLGACAIRCRWFFWQGHSRQARLFGWRGCHNAPGPAHGVLSAAVPGGRPVESQPGGCEPAGFEIRVTNVQAKFKLSQNRPEEDRHRVMDALARTGDQNEAAVARLMAAPGQTSDLGIS